MSVFRNERVDERCGGLLTSIHSSIPCKQLPELIGSVEHQLFFFEYNNLSFHLANIYDRNSYFDLAFYDQLFSLPNIIVVGDFNAHHILWGNGHCNAKGTALLRRLDVFNMVFHNDDSHTLVHRGGVSSLDLSITSSSISHLFSWENSHEFLGSDHCIIRLLGPNNSHSSVSQSRLRFNLKKANWSLFSSLVDSYVKSYSGSSDRDDSLNSIESALKYAAKHSIPIKRIHTKGKAVPWWTDECTEAIRSRNRARNIFCRSKCIVDYVEFQKLKAIAQRTIRRCKTDFWHSHCSSVDRPDRRRLWNLVVSMMGKSRMPPSILDPDSLLITGDRPRVAEIFKTQFEKNYSSTLHDVNFTVFKNSTERYYAYNKDEGDDNPYNAPFSAYELEFVIKHKCDSSPGIDSIPYAFFKHLSAFALGVILVFLNSIWMAGNLPTQWKNTLLVPIPKQGKDLRQSESYRPISLTSCFCKVYESMINRRLMYYLETNHLLSIHQSAFRPGRSTVDHLTSLVDQISKTLAVGHQTSGVFLDISKAYDLVWRTGVLRRLRELRISGPMYNFVLNFIFERQCIVSIGDSLSHAFSPDNGLPQGSVISPTLFLIMIDDIPIQSPVKYSIFADDVAIWHSSSNEEFSCKQLQRVLDSIYEWSVHRGFNFSNEKTKHVCFTRKCAINSPSLKLSGHDIERVTHVKFLGLILDRKLSFKLYVSHVIIQCQSIINLMRHISGSKWGADQRSLRIIFQSHIMAYITYAAPALLLLSKTQKAKLASVYNKGIKVMCRVTRFSNPKAVQVLAGIPPPHLLMLRAYLKYCIRSKSYGLPSCTAQSFTWHTVFNKYSKNLLQDISANFMSRHCLPISPVSVVPAFPPWCSVRPVVDISLSLRVERDNPSLCRAVALEHIHSLASASHVVAFTDGSKRDERVGYGIHIPSCNLNIPVRISDHTDIFIAEAKAIEHCVIALKSNGISKAVILSDSLSVLCAIQHESSHPAVADIWAALRTTWETGVEITFVWIPAHCGIQGNEVADSLAKASLSMHEVSDIPYSFKNHYSRIDDFVNQCWQDEWSNCSHPLSSMYVHISNKQYIFSKNLKVNSLVYSFALNVPRLNHYLSRYLPVGPLCSYCLVAREDRDHFVFNCPHFDSFRTSLRSKLNDLGIPFSWKSLLFDSQGCSAFIVFLLSSGRFDI
jgi:ribonuclease HI